MCKPKLSPIKSRNVFGLLDENLVKPEKNDADSVNVISDLDPLNDRYFVKLSDTVLEHKVLDDNQRHLSINIIETGGE